MCILCAISRWSRRIVTMLPWLIIPFIIVWALSQLLPPGFRLEVTSPRLACLGVLLSSLGWYELLLPRLSSWRARRKALLRERKRIEALEAAKWRKEATRRCRNCLTAYKVQAPGGGKFMCTYCGHVSKRPVLEVPGAFPQPAGPGIAGNSLTGAYSGGQAVKGAGVQYHRGPWRTGRTEAGSWPWATEKGDCTWFGNKWPTGAGCLYAVEGGLRGARSSTGENTHGGEKYKAGQSSSGSLSFILRILSFLRWIWRKLLGLGHTRKDGSADGSKSSQRGEDLDSFHGSRGEKARRKAKEKKQARLEKELLEAEERKQREEVARMVEERRKQREEKLEIEKESAREAAAEREREIRRDRETERRQKDKGRERATELVKDESTELEPKDATVKNKISLDLNRIKATPKQNTVKGSEFGKSAKVSKNLLQGLRFRGVKDNSTRLGYSSSIETAKRGTLSTSKANNVHGWGRVEGSLARGKSGTSATNVPGNSNLSPKSDGAKQLSDNAWKRVPWTNIWVSGNEALTGESPKMQTGMMTGSDQRLDQNKESGVNFLGDMELVVKPPMPPAAGLAIQPPIAPPSSHIDSLHQLFSTPSIFSPMDLPMDFQNQHRQKLQAEIQTSLLPRSTFFDTPACTTFEPSEASTPLSPSTSTQTPIPIQTSLLSPLQATLSVPHDRIGLTCMDNPQLLIPQGPVPDSPLSSLTETGIASYPVSPSSMSVPDPTIINTLIPSPILKPPKTDGSDLCLDKDDSLPWDLPSISLEDPNGSVDDARWQMQDSLQLHEMKISVPSSCMPDEKVLAQEPLQLPLLSTVQSTFDSKTWVPQRTSVPQEHGCLNLTADEISSAAQVANRKNIWSDFSTFNATLRAWDDSDIHQKTPPEFVDCITQEIMEDPVITADGHSYERTAIEKWLKLHNTSPKTGEVLPPPPGSNGIGVDKTLRPNHILRGQIIDYKERLARMSKLKGLSSSPASKDNGGFLKMSGIPSVWSI